VSDITLSTFYVQTALLGVDIRAVREIVVRPGLCPVPLARPGIAGLLNLKGQIVTAVDLAACLYGAEAMKSRGDIFVVLKTDTDIESELYSGQTLESQGSETLSLRVDRLGDVVSVDASQVEDVPVNFSQRQRAVLTGVVRYESGLLGLLSLSRLLQEQLQEQ